MWRERIQDTAAPQAGIPVERRYSKIKNPAQIDGALVLRNECC